MFYVNEQPHPNWPCAIAVRALSPVEPPPDGLVRLHNSVCLFAFLLAWAQAKKLGLFTVSKEFSITATRCRTRFYLLPNHEQAERMKWSLQERPDTLVDAATLVGYKRTVGIVDVSASLRSRGAPCDAAAVVSWFNTVSFNSPADKITVRLVQQ